MSIANTTISLKKSPVPGNVPTSLANGEIAINTADGILFYKDNEGFIRGITTGSSTNSFSTINVSSTLLFATSNNDVLTFDGNGAIFLTGDSYNDKIVISAKDSTISQKGVVQLYDSVDSNSNYLASTANSVNTVHLLATQAYNLASNLGQNLTSNYKKYDFTASNNQITFGIPDGYTQNLVSVYVNGVLLPASDYTALDGSNVNLNEGTANGDIVTVAKWYFDTGIYLSAIQRYDQIISTNNQILFTTETSYSPGFIRVFRNGILLEDGEYSANNGANVTLTHAASANDIVTLHYWGATSLNTTPVSITAQNAYDTANSALQSYDVANTALNLAQNAYDTANSVYTVANNALVEAQQAANSVNSKIQSLLYANLHSNSVSTTSNTSNQILDIFSSSTYRSVKYQIQVTSGTDYQSSEVSLIHNGSDSYITEYALISTNSTLMSYDSDVSGGNIRLLMNPTNTINTIKFVRTAITV